MADCGEVLVVYAKADRQWQQAVSLTPGLTVEQAIRQSGLLALLPEIDLALHRVGIFGKLKALDALVRDRDRIEIYRPLTADPKESRRRRATRREQQRDALQATSGGPG